MAKVTGLSQTAVNRIWQTFGLRPHRHETFKLSTDPDFVEKVRDVVKLYLDPPDRAIVLSVDEKSQVRALDRTQPVLPMTLGPAVRIAVPVRFDPVIEPARQEALVAELDRRGAHLRGKPRAKGDAPIPLGGRVWDLSCGWPMYRLACGPEYRYTCRLNQQSDSRACAYKWVDGPAAARFLLGCIRQRLLSPAARSKLWAKLEQLAATEADTDPVAEQIVAKRATLAEVGRKLERASADIAPADNPAQYKSIAHRFNALTADRTRLEEDLRAVPTAPPGRIRRPR